MTDLAAMKAAARKAAFAARKEAFARGQGQAAEILADFLAAHRGRALAGYMPMRTEIDPLPAMAAHDGPVLFTASELFRNAWLSVVPNRALVQSIRRYFVQVQNVRLITMREDRTLAVIVEGQRELLAACRARDAVAASDRMLRFVIEGETAFRRAMAEG